MSTQELEQKVRELRQMQAIVEEAQAEVEALKDAIKAAMGQREELRAGAECLRCQVALRSLRLASPGGCRGQGVRGLQLGTSRDHLAILLQGRASATSDSASCIQAQLGGIRKALASAAKPKHKGKPQGGRGHCTTALFLLQGKRFPLLRHPARVGSVSTRRSPW